MDGCGLFGCIFDRCGGNKMVQTDVRFFLMIFYGLTGLILWAMAISSGNMAYLALGTLWVVAAIWSKISVVSVSFLDDRLELKSKLVKKDFPLHEIHSIESMPNSVVIDTNQRKIRFGGFAGFYVKKDTLEKIREAALAFAVENGIPVRKR
jgi:hypothetical protein